MATWIVSHARVCPTQRVCRVINLSVPTGHIVTEQMHFVLVKRVFKELHSCSVCKAR